MWGFLLGLIGVGLVACGGGNGIEGEADGAGDVRVDADVPSDPVLEPALDPTLDPTEPDLYADPLEERLCDAPDIREGVTCTAIVPREMVIVSPASGGWLGIGHPDAVWADGAAYSGCAFERLVRTSDVVPHAALGSFWFQDGTDELETSWIDADPERSGYPSTCWTGSVFIMAIPTQSVGIRLMTFNELGEMTRPVQVLDPDPTYFECPSSGDCVMLASVFCLDSGPVVLDDRNPATSGEARMHFLTSDGAIEGGHVDLDLPWLSMSLDDLACTAAGDTVVCLPQPELGLVYIERDGTVTRSDPIPGHTGMYNPGDLVYTGNDVVFLWMEYDEGASLFRLNFARLDMDGRVVVPAVVGDVADGHFLLGASDGTTVLVASRDTLPGVGCHDICLRLLDLSGVQIGGPVGMVGEPIEYESGLSLHHGPDGYVGMWFDPTDVVYRHFDCVYE